MYSNRARPSAIPCPYPASLSLGPRRYRWLQHGHDIAICTDAEKLGTYLLNKLTHVQYIRILSCMRNLLPDLIVHKIPEFIELLFRHYAEIKSLMDVRAFRWNLEITSDSIMRRIFAQQFKCFIVATGVVEPTSFSEGMTVFRDDIAVLSDVLQELVLGRFSMHDVEVGIPLRPDHMGMGMGKKGCNSKTQVRPPCG